VKKSLRSNVGNAFGFSISLIRFDQFLLLLLLLSLRISRRCWLIWRCSAADRAAADRALWVVLSEPREAVPGVANRDWNVNPRSRSEVARVRAALRQRR
jgi:hypothetical protein